MRINVYGEELTRRVEVQTKTIKPECDCGAPGWHYEDCKVNQEAPFDLYGVRLYLGFPFLHREGDDDTAAITLWVPKLGDGTHDTMLLKDCLMAMLQGVTDIEQLAIGQGGVNTHTED